ncbi:YceI family protein [Corynebacterium breve]|uniref:YceI family protein n=1 Tax=Corynebacterium breve TaxID=3049799 RepID=A0ABY8VIM0_9CORY|nr:YceI family protein [Corynebacterium breve]WIM68605.1 YceI family protein [Corynebacterium breve]
MQNLNGTFVLDNAHTAINFVARHAMVTKVRGHFTDWNSTVVIDQDNPENNKAEAVINAASVNTGNADRDAHVQGEDFFDVMKFPEITFTSTKFNLDENGEGTVDGDLTIKGITKPVTLDVEVFGVEEDPFGNTRVGFEASTKVNRKDFGIDFDAPLNSGGMLVSEQVTLEVEGSGIKQA